MTASLLARTAFVTAATGAVLLSGLTVAGAAGATETDVKVKSPSASDTAVLKAPQLTVPHGRKLG
jgi:tetrahydromethanopterin S-methyltransferase subunit E